MTRKRDKKNSKQKQLKVADIFVDVFGDDKFITPGWPPDLFCFAAAVLHQSGAYTRVTSDLELARDFKSKQDREDRLSQIAEEWKSSRSVPPLVAQWWKTVSDAKLTNVNAIRGHDALTSALINLLAIADESCRGVGMTQFDPDPFLREAELVLIESDNITLCKEIDPSRYSVLPKMRTAQTGLTIRSFSHHLAFLHSREMFGEWYRIITPRDLFKTSFDLEEDVRLQRTSKKHAFNLLVIPWPKKVRPSQFVAAASVGVSDEVERGSYGLFTVEPMPQPNRDFVRRLLSIAEKEVGPINGIVMPELALDESGFQKISRQVVTPWRFFLSGVGRESSGPTKAGANWLRFEIGLVGGEFVSSLEQRKHHRWKINKSQILQYGIGTNLHPEVNWWEHIELDRRRLLFLNLRPWLTITPLLCEDLARPEPVGDLVRAIGPNLVIALLMDGPQLGGRWPGRYAASLADDPGCSVLTVTSSGMSQLSKARDQKDRSGVVALWRDPKTGTQELEMPKDADGLVLNVTVEYDEEWTADGRGDGDTSGCPILAGHHLVRISRP